MRRPPEPQYSFTIPSIHDDTTLDCRIYHPDALNEPRTSPGTSIEPQWRKKGVVMAHPYAPMGGSYDDRVVGMVVEEFLKLGWIVGTFNFRGAHGSKSHTSWSGKPELDDYISFAGFFVHYLSYLQHGSALDSAEQSPVSSSPQLEKSSPGGQGEEPAVVVLGGYSYGSLIVKHLPPLPTIIQPFASPLIGSAADEILLRARKLADQSNQEWINMSHQASREVTAAKKRKERQLSVTMGGEETNPDKRRTSREIRRSTDGSQSRGIREILRSPSRKLQKKEETPQLSPVEKPSSAISMPSVRYLLISPLTPPVSTLAAPALAPMFWNRSKDSSQDLIGKCPSLAIYGDQDIFTSTRKTRQWAEQVKATPGSRLTSVEVENAGHFWIENGVEENLRAALRNWEVEIRE